MFDSVTTRDGVDLYYQESGSESDPPVVFLHGFSGNHLSWWRQVPAFDDAYRCLAPDQRRFGRSVDRDDGPGVSAFVEDLVELLDHREIERAAVVGHSMSGWPAVSMATQHPDRVAALVLSGTPGGLLSQSRHEGHVEAAADSIEEVDPLDEDEQFLEDAIAELNVDSPAEFTRIRDTLEGFPADAETILDADVPAFLIAGEADAFMPAAAVEEVSERLDDAPFEIVEGAGHSVNAERPSAFNRHVREFLDSTATF